MKLADLGELDTPVLLFGGPYSNLQATRALREEAIRMGIRPTRAICTGDVVAYCADAAATVAEIRDWGVPVVAGNCEKQLAESALDCGCGFEEGTVCDTLSAAWYAHANAQVGKADRVWMASCPDMAVFRHAGRRFAVIHGGLSDISRFLWSTSPKAAFCEEIGLIDAAAGPVDAVIAGHSGIAFSRQIDDIAWINAGVIGMPPNNGRADTQYILLRNGEPEFCALSYEVSAAQAAMEDAGLVQGYHTALASGHWPSQDILPAELRRGA